MSSCPPFKRYDVALVTDRLQEFGHYTADMMCTVGAGAQLTAVNERLRAAEQWLPWEAEVTGPTTIGGAIATSCAGACEDGFGSPRRRVLELVAVTGLGEIIRVGAKVTKHSAGYGIHRLLCGSWGSLAVIVEATLMLAPMPGRKQYRIGSSGWKDLVDRDTIAEGLSPHLVSFTLTADANSLCAEYDVVGEESVLTWAETMVGAITNQSSSSKEWESAIRFEVDRSKIHDLARSLHDAYPGSSIRWRPLSGAVWLLHSARAEDYSTAIALARKSDATWRAELGPSIERWKVSDGPRSVRKRVIDAFDPHLVLIGEALRGHA
jgi:hypothetical protein